FPGYLTLFWESTVLAGSGLPTPGRLATAWPTCRTIRLSPWGWLVGAALALTVALLISSNTAVAPPEAATEPGATRRWLLLALLVLAATLRLPFLGSAEFQGDEARAMLLAMGIRHGQDDLLLLHRKGPLEALLPALPLVATGQVNEWTARLPFTLAGIGTVLGAYLLAERLFPRRSIGWQAGLVAALTLALDGFLIAFSRIVQYQSIVLLMSTGAVLCAWQAAQGAPHPRRWLTVSAALAAVALLAHYDGIYVLPVLVWLALWTAWQQGRQPAVWLRLLWLPALMGAGLLASFYIPFFTHEQFGGTIGYLSERVGQEGAAGGWLFNNLPAYYERATFYSTTYQMHWLIVVLAAAVLAWLLRYGRPRWLGGVLALLWAAGWLVLLVNPAGYQLDGWNVALLVFAPPLIGLLLAPAVSPRCA
ncbi:MAG: phospholipid carrier-dependent glycosyltransferase, partial [Chloroflexaceae bacterium]|nr:phospholipid carrier-dependent glycosyltransferase [Chloroflexaceae bacterium]